MMVVPGTMLQPVEILLVEDNPIDVMITKEAFSSGTVCNNPSLAENGAEAMQCFGEFRFSLVRQPSPSNSRSE